MGDACLRSVASVAQYRKESVLLPLQMNRRVARKQSPSPSWTWGLGSPIYHQASTRPMPQDVIFAFLSFLGQEVWSDSFLSFLGQGVWSDSFLSLLGQGVWSDRVGRCMLTRDEPLVPSSIQKAPRREEAEHPMRNGLACGQHGIPQCIQVSCIARPDTVNNSNQALLVSVTPSTSKYPA